MSETAIFPIRGMHIDLRTQVMTMAALYELVRNHRDAGMNAIVMEYEATFPFRQHATISNALAYTRQEVEDFVAYAAEQGVEIIPLQHCFGHAEYILQHERYLELREDHSRLSQVCPLKHDAARAVFSTIFRDMASVHPSKYFHIGCDETGLLGVCPECAAYVQEHGVSKLFMQYVKLICELVLEMGKIPVLWADIVLRHPANVDELPKEAVFIDWNYGWKLDKFGDPRPLIEQGCKFWGAPALRSAPDNFFLTNWQRHLSNLTDFIPFAREQQYGGMILTSWSTSGACDMVWEMGEVVEMHNRRHVYPLNGFRMLFQAFAQAIRQLEPLDTEAFVLDYAQQRFGLTAAGAAAFAASLQVKPEFIRFGKGSSDSSLQSLLDDVVKAQNLLAGLKPSRNQEEFAHYVLQLDIRKFYIDGKFLLAAHNAPTFSAADVVALRQRLSELNQTADQLDQRFVALNGGYLKPAEVAEENRVRRRSLLALTNRLGREL